MCCLFECFTRILFGILWFLCLIFIAYPIALFFVEFYILIQPLKAFCGLCCEGLVDFLEKVILLPRTCTKNMVTGKNCFFD